MLLSRGCKLFGVHRPIPLSETMSLADFTPNSFTTDDLFIFFPPCNQQYGLNWLDVGVSVTVLFSEAPELEKNGRATPNSGTRRRLRQ